MTPADVLKNLESTMGMKSGDWLEDQLNKGEPVCIIDLRGLSVFKTSRIPSSVQCSISELPEQIETIVPAKDTTVVVVCNGSVQSAMAVVFLRCQGYVNSFNLSGGFSSWIKNGRVVVAQ